MSEYPLTSPHRSDGVVLGHNFEACRVHSRLNRRPAMRPSCGITPLQIYQLRRQLAVALASDAEQRTRWEAVSTHEDASEVFIPAADAVTIGGETVKGDDDDEGIPWRNPKKMVKILAPHCSLITGLLVYTALGAIALQSLEDEPDLRARRAHNVLIEQLYDTITNDTWLMKQSDDVGWSDWSDRVKSHLLNLSSRHVGYTYHPRMDLKSRWTFSSAVLYTLTVLTTCGYTAVEPETNGGRFFCVGFALLGIPLMFITAADIGKFLSDWVIIFWDYSNMWFVRIRKRFFPPSPKTLPASRKTSTSSSRKSLPAEDQELIDLLQEESKQTGLLFPIGAYVSMVCGYCALGAVFYKMWEGEWSFVHAFYFSFNLITTVGLGNVIVEDALYLVLNVVYVIFGLAVVTMCVDLASSQLKAYFAKIHYFGRAHARFLGLSDDVRGMMEALVALRKGKGGKLTVDEIRALLHSQQLSMRPFCPRQLHAWRYIDETYSHGGTFRQNSVRSSNLLLGAIDPGSEKHKYGPGPPWVEPLQGVGHSNRAAAPITWREWEKWEKEKLTVSLIGEGEEQVNGVINGEVKRQSPRK